MTHFSRPCALVLAGTLGTLLAATPPAAAQQQAAPPPTAQQEAPPAAAAQQPAPLPPGSPLTGRPDTEAAKKLAPVAPPPVATAADKLPIDKLKAPKGFTIELYASGVDNARTLRLSDKGTVFVSSRIKDKIHAIVDKGGTREVKVVASGLHRPNGIVLHKGTLYIAELSQISKIDNVEDKLDNPPKPTVIFSDLPKDEAHGWKYLTIGPDEQLYFTEHQRDWLSEDIPEDKLNRVTQPGKDNFGFPYCHQGNVPDPEFGWGRSCDEFTKPLTLLGPHAAPLGMRFYTGTMFPAAYRNQIILARHGSWNRTTKIGGDLVVVKLKPDGTFRSMEPFVTGFLQNNNYVGRPVDVLVMKDGSLLVSDDYNGAVYRVSYGPQRTARR